MENKLPKNWVNSKLDDLTVIQSGGTPPRENKDYWNGEIPWVKISDLKKWFVDSTSEFITEEGLNNSSTKIFPKGTILFTIFASIGKVGVLNIDACTNQAIAGITPVNNIEHKFLTYSLIELSELLKSEGKGVAQKNINLSILKNINVPLPPLKEQQRIVAKLDTLFTHLEVLNTRLATIPKLLKNFKQAVLTQAVTGKLTEEWRKGKALDEWKEVELETIANVIDPQPSHRTPPIHEDRIPYVSIKDVNKKGKVNLKTARPVSKEVLAQHVKRYDLQEGDFAFGKIGTLGKPFLLPIFSERKYTLSANIILIQPRSKGNPKFLYYYLNSSIIEQKLREGTNSTSQPAFGIKKARKFPTPNPLPEEQTEIVKRVENLFAKADKIEAQYKILKEKTDSLPQAILAKAFKGELVAQLDTDGSAKDLLAEIKKLKAAVAPKKKMKKKVKV